LAELYPVAFSKGLVDANGNSIFGSLNFYKRLELEEGLGLKFEFVEKIDFDELIFCVNWQGDESRKHAVRYCEYDKGLIYFMDPNSGTMESEEWSLFKEWIIVCMKITK
jgi:hypothetical protein